jgi:hypothetical protein
MPPDSMSNPNTSAPNRPLKLSHRELAWRMVDEDLSPSMVYRILKEATLSQPVLEKLPFGNGPGTSLFCVFSG